MKANLQLLLACCLTGFGAGVIVVAFVTPPTGEIHSSVLVAYGETLTFAGSLLGIDYHYRYNHKE